MHNNETKIRAEAEKTAKSQGAELISFRIISSGGRRIVRCEIDYISGGISLGTCSTINKKICSYLEEENSLGENFVVEVNSPGLDKPLKKNNDFLRVKGRPVMLWLNAPVCDKDYLEGEVTMVDDKELTLRYKNKEIKINFNNIKLGKEKITI